MARDRAKMGTPGYNIAGRVLNSGWRPSFSSLADSGNLLGWAGQAGCDGSLTPSSPLAPSRRAVAVVDGLGAPEAAPASNKREMAEPQKKKNKLSTLSADGGIGPAPCGWGVAIAHIDRAAMEVPVAACRAVVRAAVLHGRPT